MLMREIEEYTISGKIYHIHVLELILLKYPSTQSTLRILYSLYKNFK